MKQRLLLAALSSVALLATTPVMASPPDAMGVWINPRGTVKVQTGSCGNNLCGRVIWASEEALSDAKDSGVNNLIGTELLQSYRNVSPGRYVGTVYVPDMGHSFYSTIQQTSANNLHISGCVLGGLVCKSQDWRRE